MAIKITRQRPAASPHTKYPRRVGNKDVTAEMTIGRMRKKSKPRKANPHPTEEERIRKMMADGRKQLAKLKAKGIPKPKPRKPKKPMKRK